VCASDVGDLCAARTDETRTNIRPCPPVFTVFRVFIVFEFYHANDTRDFAHTRSVRSHSRIAKTIIYDRRAVTVSHLCTGRYLYAYIERVYSRRGELISIGVWPRPSFSCSSCTPPHIL